VSRIIGAAGDPSVSVQQLSTLIEMDPALSASIIGVTNSAAYGMTRGIRSVHQAAVLLGLRTIRNMAVSQAVRSATEGVDTGAFDTPRFWEDSLRRANAALVIARRAGFPDPTEAFTVGLIQDLGYLGIAVRSPEHSSELQSVMTQPLAVRLEVEQRLTGATHSGHFVSLGKDWGLPQELIAVVGGHHGNEPLKNRRDERLRNIASVADAVADVVQTKGHTTVVPIAVRALAELGSREPLELETVLEQIAVSMSESAAAMQIDIGQQPSLGELMTRANQTLIHINEDYEELTRQLEETNRSLQAALAEKRDLARQLRDSNKTLSRLAATDMLTGVANRRSFTSILAERLAAAQDSGKWVSLIMMDIDHFKVVNDTFGHATGDQVLRTVCDRLSDVLREPDLIGRLGGEEFGIIVEDADVKLGCLVADRLRNAMSREPVQCSDGTSIRVTGSFGGVTTRGPVIPRPGELLQRADKALYHAKETGRNRVTWNRPGPARQGQGHPAFVG
jgi:diguanylate cyclase (GGDEF)-like protein